MSFFPQNASDFAYITYPVGPTATGVTVTSGGANAKGAYAELAASTAFACTELQLVIQFTTAASGRVYLFDIAIGAAGSEVVIVPDMCFDGGVGTAVAGGGTVSLPVAIPAGTRISVRSQSGAVGATATVVVTLRKISTVPGITTFVNYGANTGTSRGTSIDPGAVVNTKGAYVELSASTSAIIQVLALIAAGGGNGGRVTTRWYIDIATGAAASEVVIVPDIQIIMGEALNTIFWMMRSQTIFPYIAAGTRVAIRASCSITDATDRVLDVVLVTGTAPVEPSSGGATSYAHS